MMQELVLCEEVIVNYMLHMGIQILEFAKSKRAQVIRTIHICKGDHVKGFVLARVFDLHFMTSACKYHMCKDFPPADCYTTSVF